MQNLVKNWLIYRHLCETFLQSSAATMMEMKLSKIDGGRCEEWNVGDLIQPLPPNAKY